MNDEDGENGEKNWRNPVLIALLAAVAVLLILLWFFSTNRNPDQDKLSNPQIEQAATTDPSKRCSANATYDRAKRELFDRAAQARGADAPVFAQVAAVAVLRVENPVLESENRDTGGVNCSGSLSLDLPPGIAAVGGRRTLAADVDYTVQSAADGSGNVVLLRNADSVIALLATLGRVGEPVQQPSPAPAEQNAVAPVQPDANATPLQPPNVQPAPPNLPARPSASPGRPSFDCAKARTRGEIAVCSDSGLSALDRNMASQYRNAFAAADPEQQDVLRGTARRFYTYRDSCPDAKCIGDAYVGRMREIRDIMEGRWRPR